MLTVVPLAVRLRSVPTATEGVAVLLPPLLLKVRRVSVFVPTRVRTALPFKATACEAMVPLTCVTVPPLIVKPPAGRYPAAPAATPICSVS